MKRACPAFLFVVGLFGVAGLAEGSLLRMQWRGLGPDDAEITLAVGQTAIIDIYFEMNFAEETLASLSFENEPASRISQIATQAGQPGWQVLSIDSVLGDGTQWVEWTADPGSHLPGPGDYLIGSQTIRLESLGDGSEVELVFYLDSLELSDTSNDAYIYAPEFAQSFWGFYEIGLGVSEHSIFGSVYDPLIVNPIPEPGSLALLVFGAVAASRRRR